MAYGDPFSQYDNIDPQQRGLPAGLPPLGEPEPVAFPLPAPPKPAPVLASMTPPDPHAAMTHSPGYRGERLPPVGTQPSSPMGEPPRAFAPPTGQPPPAMPPMPSPQVPQAPPQDPNKLVTAGTSTTVSSAQLSKEQKAVINDRKALTGEAAATERKAQALDEERAAAQARAAEELYGIDNEHEQLQRKLIEDEAKKIEKARAQVEKAVEERKAAKITNLFDDKVKGNGWGTLLIALGGLGAAFSARGGRDGENKVLEQMNRMAAHDLEVQKQKIAALDGNVAMARMNVRDAEEAKTMMLSDAYANKAAAMGKAARGLERQLAQAGMKAPEIAADQRVQALKAQENQYLTQAYEPLTKRIQSTTQKERQGLTQQAGTAYLEKAQGLIKDDPEYKQFGESLKKARASQELEAGLQQAMKEKNPTATNAYIRLVAQQINGGVLSDGEGKQMIEQAGGVWDSANNRLAKLSSGTVSPETAKKFQGTIQNIRTNAAKTAQASRQGLMDRYGQVVPVSALNILVPEVPGQVAGRQVQMRNKQTGEVQTVLQMPDGSIRPMGG